MNRYRVSCRLRKDDDWTKTFRASAEGKHPDLAKQQILAKYPKHTMFDIEISDLSPMPQPWDTRVKPDAVKSRQSKKTQRLDLDQTWRKELAR